jgi:hypothetical protein
MWKYALPGFVKGKLPPRLFYERVDYICCRRSIKGILQLVPLLPLSAKCTSKKLG